MGRMRAQRADALREIWKSRVSSVLRAACFARTGQWALHPGDLEKVLQGDELEVFCAARAFLKAPCQTEQAFDGLSERLLHWAQGVVKQAGTALTQGG